MRRRSQQWARVSFQVGSADDPRGLAAVRRLLPARPGRGPRRAVHDRRPARAGRGRRARWPPSVWCTRATPSPTTRRSCACSPPRSGRPGNLPAAARTVRDWSRVETDRPTPERYASRIYEDMGAIDLAADAALKCRRARSRGCLGVGAGRAPAAAARGPWRRDRRAGTRPPHRPVGRGAARSRARLPPRGRRRRRGVGSRGGHPDRPGGAARPGRPSRTRWRAQTGSRSARRRAAALSPSGPTRRSRTCWRGSRRPLRAGSRHAAPPEPRPHRLTGSGIAST